MTVRGELIYINGQILFVEGQLDALRCVARIGRGRRCRQTIGLKTSDTRVSVRTPNGLVEVYQPLDSAAHSRQWLSQHCRLHHRIGMPDYLSPEWQPFDPRGIHRDAIATRPAT
ncbi:hypothetical protein [Actinoplanes xinjiangensis]|uniref:hypothetical protein n=1 Tax=Actinoplanes xinjiangensis TaxID=512350 RepID=UPI00342C1420